MKNNKLKRNRNRKVDWYKVLVTVLFLVLFVPLISANLSIKELRQENQKLNSKVESQEKKYGELEEKHQILESNYFEVNNNLEKTGAELNQAREQLKKAAEEKKKMDESIEKYKEENSKLKDQVALKKKREAEEKASSTVKSVTRVASSNLPSRGTPSSGREIVVTSTAYTASCAGCSGTTAMGINLKANPGAKVIAVDPKVIPLGTKVHVEGYGYAIAADTGGAIKGNKIDVFIPTKSEAYRWGRKTVTVKILN
jgi:3D (Asp-Asp-Asp) domain-containing protein/cell division protein FtsL